MIKDSVGHGGRNRPADVRAVQTGLGIGVDGIVGPRTRTAIREYQKSQKITVTGLIHPIDQTALLLFQSPGKPSQPGGAPIRAPFPAQPSRDTGPAQLASGSGLPNKMPPWPPSAPRVTLLEDPLIYVNLERQTLVTFAGNELIRAYACATGKGQTPTPEGDFRVEIKRPKHFSSEFNNAPMHYAMFFVVSRGIACHASYVPEDARVLGLPLGGIIPSETSVVLTSYARYLGNESAGSAGCVRLGEADAMELFFWTPLRCRLRVGQEPWERVGLERMANPRLFLDSHGTVMPPLLSIHETTTAQATFGQSLPSLRWLIPSFDS